MIVTFKKMEQKQMDNQGDQFDQWNEQKKKIQAKVKKTYAKNIILGLCGLQCLA
ncbi:hypothetical protein [Helicobacter bizzozeronii]|uniref:Uncharacterized protein n=1 Tax=Helicobacter bizzozeronii (strain CIII-1) TaxID=1002804 RepID=F8KUI5_HELBC|nr:hypothetical protein [Helicobacter bizzozeronii]CCB80920.1 hypothetical protein HBZC1_p0400 [Helicobacter bizzozeronii CIII-1]